MGIQISIDTMRAFVSLQSFSWFHHALFENSCDETIGKSRLDKHTGCPSSRSSRPLPLPHPLHLALIMLVRPPTYAVLPPLCSELKLFLCVGASSAETAAIPEAHVSVSVAPEQGHPPSDVAVSPSVLSVAASGAVTSTVASGGAAASTRFRIFYFFLLVCLIA